MSVKINGSTGIDTIQPQLYNSVAVKNWIINGQFDVWQRLAPGVTTATTSGYNADDRWKNEHSGSTKTTSKQSFTVGQTDVPNNPSYFSRTVVSSAGTTGSLVLKTQFIEDVAKLAGKTVTLSFWAKADASKNISIEFEQYFGTNGSGWVTAIGTQKFALTTTWQRFTKTATIPSIAGKTIGSGNWFGILFWFDAGSDYNSRTDSLGNQSGTFDIANVCLVEGSIPMECPAEPYAEVLRKCQRYYRRYSGDYASDPILPFSGNTFSSTIAYIIASLDGGMRDVPSAIDYYLPRICQPGAAMITTITSLTIVTSNSSKSTAVIQVIGTGFPSTAYQVINLACAIGGYIGLSAEL